MSENIIAEYEILYRETRNPLWVLEAFTSCSPEKPLPPWIFEYFAGCARGFATLGQPAWDQPAPDRLAMLDRSGLLDLADKVHAAAIDARSAVEAVPRALGLQRGDNFNAFSDLDGQRMGFGFADLAERRPGVKPASVLADIRARVGGLPKFRRKARAGLSDSQLSRRIKRAVELWAAQQSRR